jgi:uncharacterized protein (DUF1501 family)|tara:strand:+ start:609 stop:1820 length:1212 start_codon:yes stop_codon:yes gene_type:complete
MNNSINRRSFLKTVTASSLSSLIPMQYALSKDYLNGKTLVVLELSGGNDGLNTIIPYADDNYYKFRPNIGIRENKLLKIDDYFGFNPGIVGLESLYKEGNMAIIHGCGYDNPSFSHFTSMAYMHTAAPNSGEEYGWLGRLADHMAPPSYKNFIINIDKTQSLAVRSQKHVPIVFDQPQRFQREGFFAQKSILESEMNTNTVTSNNNAQNFLNEIANSANEASSVISEAWSNYTRRVDYGLTPIDLDKIAALIEADVPARLYYTSFRDNAFDTHVHQPNLHKRLLTYASDAIRGFMNDLDRMGKSQDVVLLVMTEFGRRVPENTSLGTDHGSAGPMFIIGPSVKGGHYGKIPDLVNGLDDGDNLKYTTDFRSVYATLIDKWLQVDSKSILRKNFQTFDIFDKTV